MENLQTMENTDILKAEGIGSDTTLNALSSSEETEANCNVEVMPQRHDSTNLRGDNVQSQVIDEGGELLRYADLERRVKAIIASKKLHSGKQIDDPEKEFLETARFGLEYYRYINLLAKKNKVIDTQSWLLLGTYFIMMKNGVNTTKGPKWIEWFKANFNGSELRTVQIYMRLAKISGIIYYAVIGKNGLLRIVRKLTEADKEAADPVGSFLNRNCIDFDPEKGVDILKLKRALARTSGSKAKSLENRTENLIKDFQSAIDGPESLSGLTDDQTIILVGKLKEIAQLIQPAVQGQ